MYESNITANAELDDILSLYCLMIKYRLFIDFFALHI